MSTLDTLLALTENFSGSEAITLHPERCLNTRFRALDCSICADSCPAEGAITVIDGKPALDNEACLHCGLCLHRCPTEAFTRPDGLPGNLVKTVTALPDGSVDLICPQHPHPEHGPAPQAVQTERCLAALSPATLLELSTLKKEIWLDDTPCSGCPLGQVHPIIHFTVAQANGWASLLTEAGSISLWAAENETPLTTSRPVYKAANPPVSRRGLFSAFKHSGQEIAASEEKVELVKAGKTVPVSQRLPHSVPHQRAKILSFLEKSSAVQSPVSHLPITNLPISNLQIDPTRCTACTLCAKFCPTGALKYLSDGESFALTFEPSICLGQVCDICMLACPEQAIFAQPAAASADLLNKKPLVAGELTSCHRCGEATAKGAGEATLCFACRAQANKANFFA